VNDYIITNYSDIKLYTILWCYICHKSFEIQLGLMESSENAKCPNCEHVAY